jgi:hypothetical protein
LSRWTSYSQRTWRSCASRSAEITSSRLSAG